MPLMPIPRLFLLALLSPDGIYDLFNYGKGGGDGMAADSLSFLTEAKTAEESKAL
jgi:hypothetical protein